MTDTPNMSMDEIYKIFLPWALKFEPDEGDYKREGLWYCGKCRTARQQWAEGVSEPVTIDCKCRTEENQRRAAAEKEAALREKNERNRERGIKEPALRGMTFAVDNGHDVTASKLCKKYAEKFERVAAEGIGLLLTGNVGSGKTFYACCVANAVIDSGHKAIFTKTTDLIYAMSANYGRDRANIIDRLRGCDLLVLDDIGAEKNTEAANEALFAVIDARYTDKKPIVVTTNLSPNDIKNPAVIERKRIYDRLARCTPVNIRGGSLRAAEGDAAKRTFASMLAK